ncbi:CopD family protein [Antrihabitans spumae]|uniref:CopD family protein n=1 Tax=Antrihabitans spumae TaxID=3373370 RepID=A0ABW7JU81_9NOCA
MAAGTAGSVSRWALLLAVPTAALGVSLAWQLAAPAQPQPSSMVRVIADCMGALVLGLAAIGRLQTSGRRKVVSQQDLWRPMAIAAGVWTVAEIVLLAFEASDVESSRVSDLGASQFLSFLTHISSGQVGIAAVACTAGLVAYAAVAFRQNANWSADPALVLSALALVIRPITGHMSLQPFGALLGATHALAAGLWFGLLAALALLVRTRGGWAELLPRYSEWAWRFVLVLTVSGVVNAAVRIGAFGPLFDTAYGRVVLAKTVVLLLLVGLGWWWRRTWVGQAAAHRMDADESLRRAIIEVVAMAVVFGLAAALATTA